MAAAAAAVSISMGVMKPVLAKLTTLLGNEYKNIKGLRKEVTFLQEELSYMDALLEKMDSADELDPQAKKWKKVIIEMSYNIEDRIDDFMHCVGQARDKVGILQKACEYLRTFWDRRRIANQFKEVKTQVMEASERRKRYTFDQCISVATPIVVDPRILMFYNQSRLVGIDAQKDELVNWAMDEENQLKFMAIVGIGGLGKTALANEVCREVGEKFDCKAFVSVSQKPDIIGLLHSLLNKLGLGTFSRAYKVQDHIDDLRGSLHDKRYFIVVDDLWDIQTWNIICCAFPQNSRHSRVVITTRIEGVARACCSNNGITYTMKPLSEANSRRLFFHRIFGSEEACPPELTKASYEILKKCGGLPLAIITIASMLACQPTTLEGQWEYIQNSLAAKCATNPNYEDMIYILDLSYKHLPRHLKACFLYLGSYPEDYEISRVELVWRWVAEGFVSNSDGHDVWDTAESYFNELVNRSMIQPTYKEYPSGVFLCRVHDMFFDLIARRCKEDNFLSFVTEAASTSSEAQDRVIRCLTLVGLRDIEVNTTTGQNLSQIRSFITLGQSNWMPPLMEFKFVRVLSLGISSHAVKVDLTCINQLPHLRYASVETYSTRTVLPRQIRGLRHLQTLDLSRVWVFNGSILLEMVDLPCLSHLVLPKRARLHGIGELKSLRTLRVFSPPVLDSLESLGDLGKLTAMSALSLSFPMEFAQLHKATWIDALRTNCLEKLGNLRQLHMFYHDGVAWRADKLSSLSPPFHNLEQLRIYSCTFPRVPRWIGHLKNLRRLWLGVKQLLQEDVDLVGEGAPSLVTLSLRIAAGTPTTERIVITGSTGFQAVEYFMFNCDAISSLAFGTGAMPELCKLVLVIDVRKWDKAAPDGLGHLPCLEKIIARKACFYQEGGSGTSHGDIQDAMIRRVFLEAVGGLPRNPALTVDDGIWQYRPIEEEEE